MTLDSNGIESLVTMQMTRVNPQWLCAVVSTLKHLTPVTKVYVNDMSADMLLLNIKTAGNLNALVKALQSASHLIAETAPTQAGLNATRLFYRWKTSLPPLTPLVPLTLSPSIH